MLVQVRLSDLSKSCRLEVSRLLKVEELRKLVFKEFEIEPERQKLFYGGKMLVDGQTMFDYGIALNNIITLMVSPILDVSKNSVKTNSEDKWINDDSNKENGSNENGQTQIPEGVEVLQSKYFKANDLIDICDTASGSWFEGRIEKILRLKRKEPELFEDVSDEDLDKEILESWLKNNVDAYGRVLENSDDGYKYFAKYIGYEEFSSEEMKICTFRPMSWKKVSFDDVCIGDKVLANYNIDEPTNRGFFYDCTVTGKSEQRTGKNLTVTIHIRSTFNNLDNIKIVLIDELYQIERTHILTERSEVLDRNLQSKSVSTRFVKPQCDICKDRKSLKCKECACKICGGKDDPDKQIMCDECNGAFHFTCLDPPLTSLPTDDDWFCSGCKNDASEIVRAGEKLKVSKKKSKMASSNPKGSRDWGKGMACVGREKICTIVKSEHFGPIPGIEVGTTWRYRLQVSSDGVHRPHVAGIAGSTKNGAYSLVLSGGYEDDVDNGDEFKYTGSGGRDLSGNKRTAKQSFDQKLTACNLGLAADCDAKVSESGATAKDWRKGKPVRVLRSSKLSKHSVYAPEEGIRYDGIYKVVKYWPETGQSGFRVWRYLLRRDDPAPAPWTKEGKKRMKELGLTIKYPEGYDTSKDPLKSGKASKRPNFDGSESVPKRSKVVTFKLPSLVENLIKEDKVNEKLWNECCAKVPEGVQIFNETVKEIFMCICCQDILFKPVTTDCKHNFCYDCLYRASQSLQNTCPACRVSLGPEPEMKLNKNLRNILKNLFSGYENGR